MLLFWSSDSYGSAINVRVPVAFPPHHPGLLQDAQASLADVAEDKLGELLADPDTTLALPAAAAPKPDADGDTAMQDADVSGSGIGGKDSGKAGNKSRKAHRSRSSKQQQAEGSGQAADEDEGDPCSLDDPTRLFNPRDGCRCVRCG
jgi:hypothetical protein